MATVLLYGHLGRKFGYRHELDVRSPTEAVRALKANYSGFEQYVIKHSKPGYYVYAGSENVGVDHLHRLVGVEGVIKIVPVVTGAAGDSGKALLQIVIGATLMYFSGPIGGFFNSTVFIPQLVVTIGWALVLQGVGTLFFSPPKVPGPPERPENMPNYAFDGPVNTSAQGNPVPVCYGRLRVGSAVISAGLVAEQLVLIDFTGLSISK